MFKVVHASTTAVPFRATAAPRLSVDGTVQRHGSVSVRLTLQVHEVRVMSTDGVLCLALGRRGPRAEARSRRAGARLTLCHLTHGRRPGSMAANGPHPAPSDPRCSRSRSAQGGRPRKPTITLVSAASSG